MRQHAYCADDRTKHSGGCDRSVSGAFTDARTTSTGAHADACSDTDPYACSNAGFAESADPKHIELDV